ncbi:MAG: hypothetical protein HYX90_07130 [Chloroflexi bacterium]|nr:hypothetical protein [Chloroflexota bacterium]
MRVDLTSECITSETLDEVTLRKWVGGVGIGAKYLYDEVPAGTRWDDPQNRLIVASGPLSGTRVGGSGTICICTKGCLTNGATSTQANGFMGAYLKFSGYDAIIFQGAAKRWLYLYVNDGKAELRSAEHLVGKNTWATEDAIKAELGYSEKAMSVFCIGPAGENLVKVAGIFGDKDHCAGHNGVGAVMGAKKLKAFCAARGKTPVKVASTDKLAPVTENIWNLLKSDPGRRRIFDWGTGGTFEGGQQRVTLGFLPVKNYLTNVYDHARVMTSQYVRERWKIKPAPCWACRQNHCHMVTFTDGPYNGMTVEEPEFEMWAAWGPLIGNSDPAEAMVLSNLTTLLGLEGNEAGFLVSMVIELFEKGALTKKDTGGLELTWGNTAAIRTLLERISRRDGAFAKTLAEGTLRSAKELGPEAENCGVYTLKGYSPRTHDHRAMWKEMFDTATSDIGTYESGYYGITDPDVPKLRDGFSPQEVSSHVAVTKGRRVFEDAIGACVFCTMVPLGIVVDALNAVTGWDFTPKEAQEVGFRTANLLRAFNLRHGVGVEVERTSKRWSSAPVDGPAKGITIEPHWEAMIHNYYKMMGWDVNTGKPLPETLNSLGLEQVANELWAIAPGV